MSQNNTFNNSDQQVKPVRSQNPVERVVHLVTGALTNAGTQYSAEITLTTADVDKEIFTKSCYEYDKGNLREIEYGLTFEFKAATSTSADFKYLWQGRNLNGTWIDLFGTITHANVGSAAFTSTSFSGYGTINGSLDKVPFDLRMIMQSNETNEGTARVKNSSYVRYEYQPD